MSRSKGNQAMKSGQLIECNMRNIFLERSYTNVIEKLFPGLFLKNQNWAYLWINILKFHIFCFNCLPSWGLSKVIELSYKPFAFTSYKVFLKNKESSGNSLPALFSVWFLKENISVVYSITWPNLNVWLPLPRGIMGNMCIVIVC